MRATPLVSLAPQWLQGAPPYHFGLDVEKPRPLPPEFSLGMAAMFKNSIWEKIKWEAE